MLRNYYYLNRTIVELNRVLSKAVVEEIYSQEKNSLFISIPTNENPYRHLYISTNPSLPYLVIKNEHRKAKKNILQFNQFHESESINRIEISTNDRLIRIVLENLVIVFSIMGGRTNIYFIRDEIIVDELRKNKGDKNILSRLSNTKFTNNFVVHKIDEAIFAELNFRTIKREYSFIPKELILEMQYRYTGKENYATLFNEVVNELYRKPIKILKSDDEIIKFFPETYRIFKNSTGIVLNDCNSAIQKFLQLHYRLEKTKNFKKEISKHLNKELERTTSRLKNLKERINKGERSNEYYNLGNQLLANRFLIKKGMEEISIVDYESNNEISIKLNPKKSPQESIDFYFEKAKDEKLNYKISENLFNETENKYNYLKEIEEDFNNAESDDDYSSIKTKLKIPNKKTEKKKLTNDAKLRELLIDNKYKVLVGRDSKSNDMLSIKIAKQNDYWFHARGLPGSHVVLRVEDTKVGVPKNIIKNAAQIAAFYSKAKTAGTAPVSYTLAKFVRKKKGMEPGKVLIEKEKVLLVRPGIPANATFIGDE